MKKLMSNLSIDNVIFGFDKKLKVLLIKHADGISKGKWALPGGWVTSDESLDAAASRLLYVLTGLDKVFLEQLKAFGNLNRFPNQRVVTIAYYSLIRSNDVKILAGFTASEAKWVSLEDVKKLPYDHNTILDFGLTTLRNKVKQEPIGFNLLPKQFSLYDLQKIYEAILQIRLDKPNFRRKILKMGFLTKSPIKQSNVTHRAAQLYEFDKDMYMKYKKQKFLFDI
ncbi:NUDIX domain-containing protein [Aureibaculum sp. 2210JD6-5]|uniref:NUDIX hydrolase n=1 Tax=Aureibaculum sp. 2210JD6-5 TaxID=3103957 RepID=UPI002AADCCD3|nr:NUDIX domain-containing protein [Aureibaculum sp. 2210JD6-5]MDY7396903.1 NUDIX domain-containing protein [Aureibaculum sp. 2210JD6-5]